jgi:hypothetical protein
MVVQMGQGIRAIVYSDGPDGRDSAMAFNYPRSVVSITQHG